MTNLKAPPVLPSLSPQQILMMIARTRLYAFECNFYLFNRDGVARIAYEIVKGCSEDAKAAIVNLSSDGNVKTSSTTGVATVLIMSQEDFGFNQTAVINIEASSLYSGRLMTS